MKKTLAAVTYVHTPIQYDYPLNEFIESTLEYCDYLYFIVTPPDDGTYQYLLNKQKKDNRIKLIKTEWGVNNGYERLRVFFKLLIDTVKSDSVDWIFGLDTDEILHEDCYDIIRSIVNKNENKVYKARRYNFYGDFNHILGQNRIKLITPDYYYKLCPASLAKLSGSDNLEVYQCACDDFKDNLEIFHYTYVRDPYIQLDKSINMQQWYINKVDPLVINQKNTSGIFNPLGFIEKKELDRFDKKHPLIMNEWIKKREHFWKGVIND